MKILVMKERGTAAVNVAKNCDGVVCLVQWKGNKTCLWLATILALEIDSQYRPLNTKGPK